MYWDDDGAGFPHSKIVPPAGGTGTVILGSYSRYTGGELPTLALVGQSYKAPWMSPAPWASVAEPVPSYTDGHEVHGGVGAAKAGLGGAEPGRAR